MTPHNCEASRDSSDESKTGLEKTKSQSRANRLTFEKRPCVGPEKLQVEKLQVPN